MVKKSAKADVKKEDSKIRAFVTTFLSIVGFIIALLVWRDDKYVMFYAKQSLVVFIVLVIAGVLENITFIPVIGWIIGMALFVISLLVWVFSWVYALSGKMQEVPVVGQFGRKFEL